MLETALGDGKISVLMAGYANYELVRSRSPIPTGFELIFSDLGAANRFFKGLENDPTTAINEYVSAAIGGIEDGRHAAFGGKHPRIGYLGVRRYNDEMYQAGVTVGGVKRVNSWNNISEFADFDEKHKQEKINSINRPDPNSLLPEIRHKGYEGYSSFSRPPGYFSLVEKYGSSSYDGLSMEVQRNAPPPAEALTPPERRYGVKIGWLAEGKSDKVAGGKPNGPEGNYVRGGDDTVFALFAPQNNSDGVICFGIELDGVSQGGHGDEASIVAARALNKRLSLEMGSGSEAGSSRGPKQSKDRVAGYGAAAVVDANWAVNARKRELNLPVMATTLSLFALQESGGKLYLHSWNTGDSATMVYVETDKGEFLYPVTLPDDLISQVLGSRPGDRGSGYIDDNASDADIRIRVPDPSINWTIDELQKIYQEKAQALKISAGIEPGSGIEFALGFGDQAVIRYASIELPGVGEKYKEGTVKRVKVAAMCDGIENYSSFDQQLQALRQPSANGAAMELLRLGNIADADDRSVVVAEVRPRLTETSKPIKKESPAVKTEKEWGEAMQNMLRDPVARTAYLRSGSLPAAAVAYENRAEILSGKMTKEQYLDLLKRVLAARQAPLA